MKANRMVSRVIGFALTFIMLAGVAAPFQLVDAAPQSQIAGEGWTEATLPPPVSANVQMTAEPSELAAGQTPFEDQALLQSRLPGPLTPNGAEVSAQNDGPQSPETPAATEVAAAGPGTFSIFKNSALTSAPSAALVNSPSAANNGKDVFVAYNKYAALSKNYGTSWSYINPSSLSTSTPHGALVGDQDVLYDSSRNLMLWVVRFAPDASGNTIALAVAKGRFQLEAGSWVAYGIGSQSLSCGGNNPGSRFDRPQLARTNNYLYLAANVYDSTNQFLCTTIIRLSLNELAAQAGLTLSTYYSQVGFNFAPAQGGTTTMYFARHKSTTQMVVYTWPESKGASGVTSTTVTHSSYVATGYHCPITSSTDPCTGDDDRIKTGWVKGTNRLGFMWVAAQNASDRPYPYTRVLVMAPSTKVVVSQIDIWNSSFAWFMPSSGVNARGHVGGTIAYAGGSTNPSCSAWLNDDISSMSAFAHLSVVSSDAAPASSAWGDYLTTRRSGLNPFQWVGTCYAIKGGAVTPYVVRFGRERDRYSRMKGDFNVDGKSDIAFFRSSTGLWSVRNQFSVSSFGQPGDIPVPGDYDGDGRTDVAFFRRATGAWWIRGSSPITFGQSGDVPVPADYTGDGTTDLAFYRRSDSTWHIRGQTAFAYGTIGDIPVPGDYDGNGKADVAVFRPSTGKWFVKGQFSTVFGKSGDIPVPGDYNGDGRTDLAFFRPSDGTWHITGWPTFTLGKLGDIPVPGDFDADGRTDAAYFRPSTGQWKIRGRTAITFGKSGDFPLLARDTNGDGDPYQ